MSIQNNSTEAGETCFLFDLDGVIIDSESEYSRIWRQVNEEYPSGTESIEKVIKGQTLDKILEDHYPDPETRLKVEQRLYELEGHMHYRYLPGASELLSAIRDGGYRLAMVTSSNDVKMKHLDEELPELRSRFDYIVTADKISHSKPHPEGYLLGASKLGCDPRRSVVFEDSLQGVKAGKASGAYVVGVAGTLTRDALEPYSDIVVDSLEELTLPFLVKASDDKYNANREG